VRHFLLLLTGLIVATLVASISPAYADAECSDLPLLRSKSNANPVNLVFSVSKALKNLRFKIYWINYEGEKRLQKELGAGESYRINTYMTHPWLVTVPTEDGGETCRHIYTSNSSIRTIHID